MPLQLLLLPLQRLLLRLHLFSALLALFIDEHAARSASM